MIYPELKTVLRHSKKYNRIPVYKELNLSELGLLSLLKALQGERDVIFLESAKENKTWSRFSFFGLNPKKEISCEPPHVIVKSDEKKEMLETDFFAFLKNEVRRYRSPVFKRFGDFNGGLVGFFGFELVNHTGIMRAPVKEDGYIPLSLLVQIDDFIVYDNKKDRYFIASCMYAGAQGVEEEYAKTCARLEKMEGEIVSLIRKTSLPYLPSQPERVLLSFRETRESFMDKVAKTKELITAGEAIQVVLSMRASIENEIDPYSFYLKLRSVNPSPYMFFLKFGRLHLVGSSPEIHVRVAGDEVTLKPIAGTARRGKNGAENRRLREALLADEKERAEHLMLVDLARNDLGRISASGSVSVEKFMVPEDFSHVIHLVSVVTSRLAPGSDMVDVLRETFPAGTVSGAPKVRALEIINEMEEHSRDIYAGAVGYIGYNGVLDTCITIRTAVFSPEENYLQAGAGIVYDSVPEREYEEVQNKLKALSLSLQYAKTEKREAAHVSHDR